MAPSPLAREQNVGPVAFLGQLLSDRPRAEDVNLADTFTNEVTGEVYTCVRDAVGNHFWILSGGGVAGAGQLYKFLGTLAGDVVPVSGFIADTFTGSSTGPFQYPVLDNGAIRGLRVFVDGNSMTGNTLVTVFVNGVATGLFVTVPGLASGEFFAATQVPVLAGDRVDVQISNASGGGGGGNGIEVAAVFKIS